MTEDLVRQSVELPGGELCLLQPEEWADLPDDGAVEWAPLAPYWSVLWRSGVALARELDPAQVAGLRVVELGCGLGVPSLAAARAGAEVLATDASAEALALLGRNARENEFEPDGRRGLAPAGRPGAARSVRPRACGGRALRAPGCGPAPRPASAPEPAGVDRRPGPTGGGGVPRERARSVGGHHPASWRCPNPPPARTRGRLGALTATRALERIDDCASGSASIRAARGTSSTRWSRSGCSIATTARTRTRGDRGLPGPREALVCRRSARDGERAAVRVLGLTHRGAANRRAAERGRGRRRRRAWRSSRRR